MEKKTYARFSQVRTLIRPKAEDERENGLGWRSHDVACLARPATVIFQPTQAKQKKKNDEKTRSTKLPWMPNCRAKE
jgi:hypothetical protein